MPASNFAWSWKYQLPRPSKFFARKMVDMSFVKQKQRTNPNLSPVTMNSRILNEASCLEYLLGFKFIPDFKENSYFDCERCGENLLLLQKVLDSFCQAKIISKSQIRLKMQYFWYIDALYRSRKYLTPSKMFYLYKSRIRPTIEYDWHILAFFHRWQKSKSFTQFLVIIIIFHLATSFLTDTTLQAYRCSNIISIVTVQKGFIH